VVDQKTNRITSGITLVNTNAIKMIILSESCGLAVEHWAHGWKVVGLIPVQSNAKWKWCQNHARIDFCTQFWFIIENKKNIGSQMGHTKKIFIKK